MVAFFLKTESQTFKPLLYRFTQYFYRKIGHFLPKAALQQLQITTGLLKGHFL